MLLEIGIIAAGIPVGWLLRRNRKAQALTGRALTWSVWILLFLLGFALGGDERLLAQLDSLGVRAVTISLLSVAGSLLAARLLGAWLPLDDGKRSPTA